MADVATKTAERGDKPEHGVLVLAALILAAAVANLNLSVANVALPEIGKAFDASQTELNLVAVAYSLGLASSVLYLGAIGDRYGRKRMLVLGTLISIPACLVAAWAPTIEVLIAGRLLGGLGAGMAFPTTLALVTALWRGASRTKSIALWSGIGGSMNALGPVVSGALLLKFAWESVFLITLPLALIALVMVIKIVPKHVNETTDPVDNAGGVMSAIFVAAVVIAINFAGVPGKGMFALGLAVIGLLAGVLFFRRQARSKSPLFDLKYAKRSIFWVAACAGMIVFGSLMGAMFIGQQFLQDVLGYTTFEAGLSIIPGAVLMVLVAPQSAKLVETRGSRFTLLLGDVCCLLGFALMLFTWGDGISYLPVGIAYALIGAGVGLAGPPAAHSLTGAVPVKRVGMASGTADLQRDLGGAVMQSILGALLTAGYAASFSKQIGAAPGGSSISASVQTELEKSYSSAAQTAERYPQYADQIISAAKIAFTQGQSWAYTVGLVAITCGALLVWKFFPDHATELKLLGEYGTEDAPAAAS
ncbi:MAG: MFS transporter [Solirubrobacterales bacterium]|nr:MFS transporter [Solirubrobacterales bacterium]